MLPKYFSKRTLGHNMKHDRRTKGQVIDLVALGVQSVRILVAVRFLGVRIFGFRRLHYLAFITTCLNKRNVR